jgi:hypothetical protein
MNLPEGWRSITVGTALEPLPESTQQSVLNVLRAPGSSEDKSKALRAILEPHAAILEEHGIVADYLAYVLVYTVLPRFKEVLNKD